MSLVEPVGYIEFLGLMARACVVFTDSGGIQEETTALGVPCVTMRNNTERPITVQVGTNQLSGIGKSAIVNAAHGAVLHKRSKGSLPPLWDGQASRRIVDVVQALAVSPPPATLNGLQ